LKKAKHFKNNFGILDLLGLQDASWLDTLFMIIQMQILIESYNYNYNFLGFVILLLYSLFQVEGLF
jgi:hypothetical protein